MTAACLTRLCWLFQRSLHPGGCDRRQLPEDVPRWHETFRWKDLEGAAQRRRRRRPAARGFGWDTAGCASPLAEPMPARAQPALSSIAASFGGTPPPPPTTTLSLRHPRLGRP
ncbi:hypothetical protein EVAR_68195_1 [Eumeta japonica]|uniref:Uncharacterized protein n=1 Tax=Eumeta variegata TaxID=151549 RepID=A0A4C2A1S1_EUMVA|nr:hypothetical protein EVAR_68195_1 [Eumeta japonica]